MAREMDEPYPRLVLTLIEIVLHLFGLIEDHVAGRDNDLFAIQDIMSLSGCYIDDLPVHPASGP